ncbi:hypothetical protein [Halobaculum marinum]|uniref:Uncharacterized protein n=1 Tax=Halobaculum marinum TaxID=3031996 RepID=A0ABD5WZR9_9EURY|nr:hypothetical protein [Halobaculum sp. DT55]
MVSILITSVVAFAGTSAAVRTTVDGPDQVTKGDRVEFTSTADVRDDERVPVESLTLTIRPEDSPDEEVRVTVAPNGTVLSISPSTGVVGQGEIRIEQLRRSLDVAVSGTDGAYGYGYGYQGGIDERAGENGSDATVGYGYGYGDTSITVEAAFSSKALKHGNYEAFLTVNTGDERDQFRSNVESFEVLVPGNGSPPDNGEGPDNRPGDDVNEASDDSEDDDSDEVDSDDEDSEGDDSDESESEDDDAEEHESDEDDADAEDDDRGEGNGPPENPGAGNGPPAHANGNGPPSDVPRGGR